MSRGLEEIVGDVSEELQRASENLQKIIKNSNETLNRSAESLMNLVKNIVTIIQNMKYIRDAHIKADVEEDGIIKLREVVLFKEEDVRRIIRFYREVEKILLGQDSIESIKRLLVDINSIYSNMATLSLYLRNNRYSKHFEISLVKSSQGYRMKFYDPKDSSIKILIGDLEDIRHYKLFLAEYFNGVLLGDDLIVYLPLLFTLAYSVILAAKRYSERLNTLSENISQVSNILSKKIPTSIKSKKADISNIQKLLQDI